MLYEVSLENFKPFGSRQLAPLAAITLVYGPNSGGKSSLIQALMLLRQSIYTEMGMPSTLVPRGEFVDLGSFKSLLHKHDVHRELAISLAFDHVRWRRRYFPGYLRTDLSRNVTVRFRSLQASEPRKEDAATVSFAHYNLAGPEGFDVRIVPDEQPRLGQASLLSAEFRPVQTFRWEGESSWRSLARYVASSARRRSSKRGAERQPPPDPESTLDTQRYEAFLEQCILVPMGFLPARLIPEDRETRQATLSVLADPERSLQALALEYYELIRSFSYLGPLRSHPARHYLIMGAEKDSVGVRGESAPEVIYRRRRQITADINRWFGRFEIPYELKIKSIGDEITGEVVSMTLTDTRTKVLVSPSDVGFGIGQLLPIIVEGVIARGRVICVEQPEIHLHPRLQAHVADFLIETAGSRPREERRAQQDGPANQWIVETHSEALMLRLQRRIREGRITAEDVSVLYVDPSPDGSRIRVLRLDEDGEFIDEWPHGFFEERYQELFGEAGS